MEEFEKNDSRVPKWKVEWVRENLKHMIGRDDLAIVKKKSSASPLKARKSLKKKLSTCTSVEEEEVDLS